MGVAEDVAGAEGIRCVCTSWMMDQFRRRLQRQKVRIPGFRNRRILGVCERPWGDRAFWWTLSNRSWRAVNVALLWLKRRFYHWRRHRRRYFLGSIVSWSTTSATTILTTMASVSFRPVSALAANCFSNIQNRQDFSSLFFFFFFFFFFDNILKTGQRMNWNGWIYPCRMRGVGEWFWSWSLSSPSLEDAKEDAIGVEHGDIEALFLVNARCWLRSSWMDVFNASSCRNNASSWSTNDTLKRCQSKINYLPRFVTLLYLLSKLQQAYTIRLETKSSRISYGKLMVKYDRTWLPT